MSSDGASEVEAEGTGVEGGFSRRAFLKFLLGASVILTVIPFVPMVKFFFSKKAEQASSRKRIANVKELPEGSTKVFFYPGEEDIHRSFLVHLPQGLVERARAEGRDEFITRGFVAFNTICTHLQCPTDFPKEDQIICPCHGGYFSLFDGTVIAGPPPRPLPAIRLEVEETGDIYAVELVGKIGRGRD
ncbi:MAG: ubiquinol-cytochrome c reductase iron-sulfur subunit [Candidatus Bathyarchaeia archaeon]